MVKGRVVGKHGADPISSQPAQKVLHGLCPGAENGAKPSVREQHAFIHTAHQIFRVQNVIPGIDALKRFSIPNDRPDGHHLIGPVRFCVNYRKISHDLYPF